MAYKIKFKKDLAKGIVKYPTIVKVLPPKEYDKLREFKSKKRVKVAFTRILKSGKTFIFVSDTGDELENDKLIAHEIKELSIFRKNLEKGILDPRLAHKLNIGRLIKLEWKE